MDPRVLKMEVEIPLNDWFRPTEFLDIREAYRPNRQGFQNSKSRLKSKQVYFAVSVHFVASNS